MPINTITDELDIKIKTEGRFIVEFGTSNSLENKFAHLAGMIKNIDQSKTGTVNLSMWSASNTEGALSRVRLNRQYKRRFKGFFCENIKNYKYVIKSVEI